MENKSPYINGSYSRRVSRVPAPLLVALTGALLVRIALLGILTPGSDVYYFLAEAASTLISGGNPYVHTYTSIPPDLLTQGAERVFAYLPFSILYLIPFSFSHEIRIGFVVADLVIGGCLYYFGGRLGLTAAVVFLFLPYTMVLSTYLLNVALIGMMFMALFFCLSSRGAVVPAAILLGFAFAAIQFSWFLFAPLTVYAWKAGLLRLPVIAVTTSLLVIAPFLLWSPAPFVNETLLFEFQRGVLPLVSFGGPLGINLNPSLNGILHTTLGIFIPGYVKVATEVAIMAVMARVSDFRSFLRNSFIIVLASAVILPNDFFWSYLETPLMLFLFWRLTPPRVDASRVARPEHNSDILQVESYVGKSPESPCLAINSPQGSVRKREHYFK